MAFNNYNGRDIAVDDRMVGQSGCGKKSNLRVVTLTVWPVDLDLTHGEAYALARLLMDEADKLIGR